jgi:hypothetical protein
MMMGARGPGHFPRPGYDPREMAELRREIGDLREEMQRMKEKR